MLEWVLGSGNEAEGNNVWKGDGGRGGTSRSSSFVSSAILGSSGTSAFDGKSWRRSYCGAMVLD